MIWALEIHIVGEVAAPELPWESDLTASPVAACWRKLLLISGLLPLLAGAGAPGRIELSVEGLRSNKGVVRICLTKNARHFPDCNADPQAVSRTLSVAEAKRLSMPDLAPGTYALSLFHDENGNARLDTFAAIPREGFGFSRNPRIRFGPPSFTQVAFPIASAPVQVTVRMQYFL